MKKLDTDHPVSSDGLNQTSLLRHIRDLKASINELIDEMEAVQKVVFVLCERKKK